MSDFESKYVNFQGAITECGVWETPPPEPTTPYDTVIRADQPWLIHLKWEVAGLAVPVQAGQWHVDAYLESMGSGPEFKLPIPIATHVMPLTFGQTEYLFEHTVDPDTVPVEPGHSTPYKLVVTVVYHRPDGQPGPMAGFVELPVLQFYKAIG
jgi:hypothetical protein